jgi:hypothetical protein
MLNMQELKWPSGDAASIPVLRKESRFPATRHRRSIGKCDILGHVQHCHPRSTTATIRHASRQRCAPRMEGSSFADPFVNGMRTLPSHHLRRWEVLPENPGNPNTSRRLTSYKQGQEHRFPNLSSHLHIKPQNSKRYTLPQRQPKASIFKPNTHKTKEPTPYPSLFT